MRRALRFVVLLFVVGCALGAASACNKPLDESQCQSLVDKMVDLAALDEPKDEQVEKVKTQVKADKRTMQNVKDTCIGKMTKSQYDCVMGSKTFQDAMQCDQK